ncbi:hypothetical protein [Bifidobacterium sp. SO1]|uniref:hypothetical protein n=1 Tax=Bifidobacterium sp. SO1 TaxID=2809029 RepID=UPI001BDDB454|nr:hypothetical protein [Bifidobacterium sp. SO1]MBT1161763.1 hypothetical protein [Bifidobacterium sp. SO1]
MDELKEQFKETTNLAGMILMGLAYAAHLFELGGDVHWILSVSAVIMFAISLLSGIIVPFILSDEK